MSSLAWAVRLASTAVILTGIAPALGFQRHWLRNPWYLRAMAVANLALAAIAVTRGHLWLFGIHAMLSLWMIYGLQGVLKGETQ